MLKELEYELERIRRIKENILKRGNAIKNVKDTEDMNAIKTIKDVNDLNGIKFRCASRNNGFAYYIGNEYIPKKDIQMLGKIAMSDYCQKLYKCIQLYESRIEQLINIYRTKPLENIYRNLHPGRKALIDPLVKPIEDIIAEFNAIVYEGNAFDKNDKTEFYTKRGERVRSKSEMIIANELYRYDIPYKYEMPLNLLDWNKEVTFYPDFTTLNKRTGKKWIMEHFGMMEKQNYFETTFWKLDVYEKNGILLGKDLIILHESLTSPLNINVVRKYIEEYLC